MGYCRFFSFGSRYSRLYRDKQGTGARQGVTRPSLRAGTRSSARTAWRSSLRSTRDMGFVSQPRNKISVITNISVLGFYGYIGNIDKYR